MSKVDTAVATQILFRHYSIVSAIAWEHTLDTALVLAIVAQESAGNEFAIRCEPGFWRRYGLASQALIKRTPNQHDDRWVRYSQIVSASYGLMQVLYVVAIERGMILTYPTELCRPSTGVEAGCRQLVYCYRQINHLPDYRFALSEHTRRALLRYNGGGNALYPSEVLAWREEFRTAIRSQRKGKEKT